MRAEAHPSGKTAALGAVLAGGRGSRLGGAKAAVELGGLPLVERPLGALAAAGIEPFVVAGPDTELPPLAASVLRDGTGETEGPRHPLRGIVAALRHARPRPVVVVACDMPFLPPALLAALAAAPEPLVAPAPGGGLQPLCARYAPSLLGRLEVALRREEPLRRSVRDLGPRLLEDADLERWGDPRWSLFNVNDRADLRRARRRLGSGPVVG